MQESMRSGTRPPTRCGWAASVMSAGIADPVDGAGPVIRHQDRAILGDQDVVRTTRILLVAGDPALAEDLLLGILAVRLDRHPHDPAALLLMAVPGAMLGDQDVVLVLRGELGAGVEPHPQRGDMRTEVQRRRREFAAA